MWINRIIISFESVFENLCNGIQENTDIAIKSNMPSVGNNNNLDRDTFSNVNVIKVSKGAKIRNRYNQVSHLTQDTNGKVTDSHKIQQTTPFHKFLKLDFSHVLDQYLDGKTKKTRKRVLYALRTAHKLTTQTKMNVVT